MKAKLYFEDEVVEMKNIISIMALPKSKMFSCYSADDKRWFEFGELKKVEFEEEEDEF